MGFDSIGALRLAMEKGALVEYRPGGGKIYVGTINSEKDGKFHFKGTLTLGTEKVDSWPETRELRIIE